MSLILMPDNHQKGLPDKQPIVEQVQQEVAQGFVQQSRASKRTKILIIAYLVLFVLFLTLSWFVHVYPIFSVDVVITQEFQEHRIPWLKSFMIAVSFLGNQFLIFTCLILLTAVVFWLIRLRMEALFIAGLSIISATLNALIKYIVNRPRPTSSLVEILQHATGSSFPSGHVMSYVAYWGLLFSFGLILLKRDRWWHYLSLIIPGLFVLLVGPSRIYLGDHWASDVLGAYMFGGLLLGIALWLYLALKGRGM
jgi:undecaprenyl-diphosphatase